MDRSRVLFVLVLVLLPLGGLQARLVQLQLVDPDSYALPATAKRQTIEILRPRRGPILDRKRRVLAEDRRSFDCYLVLEEYEKNPGPLAPLLGMPAEEFQQKVEEIYEKIEKQVRQRPPAEQRRLYQRERRAPYLLRKGISFEAAIAIETSPGRYGGAVVRENLVRNYPFGPSACHVVGYLGRVTGNEREFLDRLQDGYFFQGFEEKIGQDGIAQLYRRGDFHEELIGRTGVEHKYDALLRGRSGLGVVEREPGTSNRTVIELLPSEPGADLELTIDLDAQRAAEEALGTGLKAAAVVLDPATGAVLAIASNRFFDPNDFSPPGNPAAVRRVLGDDEGKPLQSLAFAQQFQEGSVFKEVTAVAALEEKKVGPAELLPCRGRFDERLQRGFACWIWNNWKGMHGELALPEALEKSCNCYFYEAGKRAGMDALLRWARALGYGARTEIDLPGEAPGRLPDRARWENDVLSLAIGQHELMATPLQAAVMTAAIANGGFRVRPHVRLTDPPAPAPLGISAATLAAIRQGLHDVTFSPHGTAHKTDLKKFGAVGKTSTAQAGGDRHHAWFAGYAPEDKPRFAIVVFVEGGGHGGETAAPIAARILERLFQEK
jgi:penicillin-binding protein 2